MASISIHPVRRSDLRRFLYNLALIAPGKGDAKKTVSQGNILIHRTDQVLVGIATDDIVSIHEEMVLGTETLKTEAIGVITQEEAKKYIKRIDEMNSSSRESMLFEIEPSYDYNFWWDVVYSSINNDSMVSRAFDTTVAINPERLRKFGLLEPRGTYPLDLQHIFWGDREIVRWKYGPKTHGVVVPLDRDILRERFGEEEVLWKQSVSS